MAVGTVAWFDERKGYGFITCPNEDDVFVHYKSIVMNGFKTLSVGWIVEFTKVLSNRQTRDGKESYVAHEVKPIIKY